MMKKRLLAGLTCAALLAGPSAAFAESTDVNLYVNDAYIGGSEADGQAYINDAGRTMIPLRIVGDVMGYETDWSAGTIHVTGKDGAVDVTMTVGETAYTAGGEAGTFETAPVVKDGRTYLPARDFSEIYGNVYWDGATRSVWVTQGDELRYNVIGQTLYRSDANGIQVVALPEGMTITTESAASLLGGIFNTPDGTVYLTLNYQADWSSGKVPLFRDAGDHLDYVMDVFGGGSVTVDDEGTVYYAEALGAGPWQPAEHPNWLYVTEPGASADDPTTTNVYEMDFDVSHSRLSMNSGSLVAMDIDGNNPREIDLSGLTPVESWTSQQ